MADLTLRQTSNSWLARVREFFGEVYAVGKSIVDCLLPDEYGLAGVDALRQFGTYDFQRARATNTFYSKYSNAANYAVGVYMNGAGHDLYYTIVIARGYAAQNSSNPFSADALVWTMKGWKDAQRGNWR